MSAAGRTSDASGDQHDVDVVTGAQHRQVLLGTDVRHDRGAVGGGQRQPQHRTLEGEIDDLGAHGRDVTGGRFHRDPHPFRADHQRGLPARFDRGVTRLGLELGAQHLDLDEVAVGAAGLTAVPQVRLADEAGHEHGRGPVVDLGRGADLFDVALRS